MFVINEDNSIYATRGDIVFFKVTADDNGKPYTFQSGDVLRIKIFGKKDAESVIFQKDFPVANDTEEVEIFLEKEDIKFGEVISKPKDYWYEVELNPLTNPQTIIGYDDDGAKVFKLFPEGADIPPHEPIKPEDIPFMDDELDLTSTRPVENQAVARGLAMLTGDIERINEAVAAKTESMSNSISVAENDIAVERARIDNFVSGATPEGSEVVDIRVGADGVTYGSAGTAVREQISLLNNLPTRKNIHGKYVIGTLYSGQHNGNNYRIHTESPIRFEADTILTVDVGYRFAIQTMSVEDETVFVSDSGWFTDSCFVPANTPVHIVIGQNPEATVNADIGLYKSKLWQRTSIAMQNDIDSLLASPLSITGKYVRGTLNSGVVSGHNARVITDEMQHSDSKSYVITAKDGYRFAIVYYGHSGNFYHDTGWLTGTYIIPAGAYWKMIIAKDPDNEGAANITEYANAVIVSNSVSAAVAEVGRSMRKVTRNFGGEPVYRAINHRGYNSIAPENTLPAFILSKKMGFDIVETDVRFTSDGYAVLLHDPTVDRTSNGTGKIAEMTFEDVRKLDFGSWKSAEYAGTQIPTFEEFVTLCKKIGLHIYCELEADTNSTESNIRSLVNTVKRLGMESNITWISFDPKLLAIVGKYLPAARLMINVNAAYWGGLYLNVLSLKTPYNEVGLNYQYDLIDGTLLDVVYNNDIPLEVWTVNDEDRMMALPGQVSGITSDTMNCNDIFRKHYLME